MPIPYSAIFDLIGINIPPLEPCEVAALLMRHDVEEYLHLTTWHLIMHEDALPEMTDDEYNAWYADSLLIDGVRMGRVIKSKKW
jgi:hypothetical protein